MRGNHSRFPMALCLLLSVFVRWAGAAEPLPLVTYGPSAPTYEGDPDYTQEILFRVPTTVDGQLHLRVFDADTGGTLDEQKQTFDTRIRFRLVGPGNREIGSTEIGEDALRDGAWTTLASFTAGDFPGDDNIREFRLFVEGVDGDDGNVYHVALSESDKRNVPPPGLHVVAVNPTVRLPREGVRGEMRFFVPEGTASLRVRNFDLAGARVALETVWRSGLRLRPSRQATWAEDVVSLDSDEGGRMVAVVFEGGGEIPNDATFEIYTDDGSVLPVEVPPFVQKANRRPVPRARTLALADCATVVFDAAGSSDADGDALLFFWDFGDGGKGEGQRTAHAFDAPGEKSIQLHVQDSSGQVGDSARLRFTVPLNAPPTAMAGPDLVGVPGVPLTLDASESSDSDGRVRRWVWDLGDGAEIAQRKIRHAWRTPGTYQIRLRVEDDADSPCNFGTDELSVWINAPPVLELGADLIASPGEPISLSPERAADPDGEILAYDWDFGDGTTGDGRSVSHAWEAPGTYTVKLVITDDAETGNSAVSDTMRVVVNDRPVANAGPDHRRASGEEIAFDGRQSRDPDGKLIAWRWDFGDGSSADGELASHAYASPGVYDVVLTVTDDSGSATASATDTARVVVNAPPVARAGGDQRVTSSEVQFDGTASSDADGEIIAWAWDFGDGQRADGPTPVHVYRRAGVYRVRLEVTDDSATATKTTSDTLEVVVNATPIADAGGNRTAAPGQTLRLDGSGSLDPDGEIGSWNWDFGDGTSQSGAVVEHAWERPGTYPIRLTVTDTTGDTLAVGTDEATVVVNREPVAQAGPDRRIAPGEEVRFDASGSYDVDGGHLTYHWSLGAGGDEAEGVRATRRFEEPGTYTIRLTVNDASGTLNAEAYDEAVVVVNQAPRAQPGQNQITCSSTIDFDASASVDADGDPLQYRWDFGDGSPEAAGVRVSHTFARGGTYPVVLTVDDNSGLANARHSAVLTVQINEPPLAEAGEDRLVCAGSPVLLSASGSTDPEGGVLKYEWEFGQGETGEGLNPTTQYQKGGTYRVRLKVTDDSTLPCNTAEDTLVLAVAESPVAQAGEDQTVCANTPVKFDGSASRDFADDVVDSFTWTFGDGATAGGVRPVHVYEEPGEYRVMLDISADTVGDCDNTDSDEMIVNVLESPRVVLLAPEAAAVGSPIDFASTGTHGSGREVVSMQWDFGDGTTATGPTANHTYANQGRYAVSLTVTTDDDSACKSSTARQIVVANAAPRAEAGADRRVGIGEVVQLSAAASKDPDGEITRYLWDFADGTTLEGPEVRHRWRESGRYEVRLTVTDDTELPNRQTTDTVIVTVNAPPQPRIEGPDRACVGEAVDWNARSSVDPDGSIATFQWAFGDGATGVGEEVQHRYGAPGRYELSLTADDGTGVDNALGRVTRTIAINQPPMPVPGPEQVVCPGEEVVFDAADSSDPDGRIDSFHWNFGDGTEATVARTTHVFDAPGRYDVVLEVDDGSGTTCGSARAVVRVVANAAPDAQPGEDRQVFVGGAHDAVLFDAGGSSDPDGDPLLYRWEFGDGTSAVGSQARHAYTRPGSYTARLIVSDGTETGCGQSIAEISVDARERSS